MKKIIFAFALFLSATIGAFAQKEDNVNYSILDNERFVSNWSIGIHAGPSYWLGYDKSQIGDKVRPVVGVSLSKMFSHSFGAEVFANFDFQTPKTIDYATFSNFGVNGLVNLNNLFHGYYGRPDLFEVVPFMGFGWGHAFPYDKTVDAQTTSISAKNYLMWNTGVQFNFNMGKQRAWQINIIPAASYAVAGTGVTGGLGHCERLNLALSVGVTYKFGYKNSKGKKVHNYTSVPVPYYSQAEVAAAVEAALKDRKPEIVEVLKEVVVRDTVVVAEKVEQPKTFGKPCFEVGAAKLDQTSANDLAATAEYLNSGENKDKTYVITGYASVEGSEKANEKLSLARATAVKNALVESGVEESRIETVAGGPTEKFGPKYEQNRVVVIEEKRNYPF